MPADTTITVVGNLTADPDLRFTASGVAVTGFTVASTPRTFDRASGEWKDGDTLFLRCTLWRQPAENTAETLTKATEPAGDDDATPPDRCAGDLGPAAVATVRERRHRRLLRVSHDPHR